MFLFLVRCSQDVGRCSQDVENAETKTTTDETLGSIPFKTIHATSDTIEKLHTRQSIHKTKANDLVSIVWYVLFSVHSPTYSYMCHPFYLVLITLYRWP